MDGAKLAFSAEELRLVSDPGIILTKNAIIGKVYALFGGLAEQMRKDLILPEEVAAISPKISRGEAYQGLPYVMLDHPRYFSAGDILAIRTFFWWGHFFSVTLHLKGRYQYLYRNMLSHHYERFHNQGYAVSVCEDEWQHDTGSSDYRAVSDMGQSEFGAHLERHPFVKISASFPVTDWERMPMLLRSAHVELAALLRI